METTLPSSETSSPFPEPSPQSQGRELVRVAASYADSMKGKVKTYARRAGESIQHNIIGPMEKGMAAAKMQTPPTHVIDGVDLRTIPKYISYKAAMQLQKRSLQSLLWLACALSAVLFIESRWEISRLYDRLRSKEYILAPGVQDFTPVSPQNVPDSHVENAAMAFLQAFGNISASNIDEQYKILADNMSPELKIKFEQESAGWKAQVKDSNLSEILSITDKQIQNNHDGYYKVVAYAHKDSYANAEHIGSSNVVIQMVLKLVPPKAGKLWYLEIENLETQTADSFRARTTINQGSNQTGSKQ